MGLDSELMEPLNDPGDFDLDAMRGYTSLDPGFSNSTSWLDETLENVDDGDEDDNFVSVPFATGDEQAKDWSGQPTEFASPSTSPASKSRQHPCSECRATFETGHALERHAIEHGHRSFACPDEACSKAYCRRDARTRHAATHEKKQTCSACKVCSAEFARKDHLQRHMRVQHPDEHAKTRRGLKKPGYPDMDIKKVKESEPALRRTLPPENLAIKMLNIAGQFQSTEEGAQKAFACVVARAALDAAESDSLGVRTKQRLQTVKVQPTLDPLDLDMDLDLGALKGVRIWDA